MERIFSQLWIITMVAYCVTGQYPSSSDSYNSVNARLHRFLLTNYNKFMRPVLHPSDNITIYIQGAPYQIINVDQKRNLIEISAYFELIWNDQYLTWDPTQYENATEISLASSSVWRPELILYYSADHQKSLLESRLNVRVTHTGQVRYFVPFTGESLCPIDVKYFPFDTQNCTLRFGSWTHSNDGVELKLIRSGEANLIAFYDNQEWQLQHCSLNEDYNFMNSIVGGTGGNHKAVIAFHMIIERQSFYYIFNLVIPSALITLVAVIGFHMPSMSTGGRYTKFRLGMMTLLSMSVLLLSVATEMPKFSIAAVQGNLGSFSGVPLIGIYYFNLLAIISCNTITSSWFVVLEKQVVRSGVVPWYFKYLQFKKNKNCFRTFYRGYHPTASNDVNNVNRHQSSNDEGLELPETGVRNTNVRNVAQADGDPLMRCVKELKTQIDEAIVTLSAVQNVLKDPLCSFTESGISVTLGRIEKLSLYFYLFLVFLTIFMFFVHTWWY